MRSGAGGCASGCGATPISIRSRTRIRRRSTTTRRPRRPARRGWWTLGFTAVKFDPAGAYTIHGGHQPTLPDLDRSEAFCRRIREAVGRPGRPALRDARAVHAFGRDPAGAADRALRSALVRGAGPAGRAARPRGGGGAVAGADRLRRAADHQGGVRDAAARRRRRGRCSRASGGSAACSRRARSRCWRRVSRCRWRRTSTPGRSPGRRRSSSALSIPNFLILETIGTGGGFHADAADAADPLGGRLRAAAGGAGPRASRSTRRWRGAHPWTGDRLHLEMSQPPSPAAALRRRPAGSPVDACARGCRHGCAHVAHTAIGDILNAMKAQLTGRRT